MRRRRRSKLSVDPRSLTLITKSRFLFFNSLHVKRSKRVIRATRFRFCHPHHEALFHKMSLSGYPSEITPLHPPPSLLCKAMDEDTNILTVSQTEAEGKEPSSSFISTLSSFLGRGMLNTDQPFVYIGKQSTPEPWVTA